MCCATLYNRIAVYFDQRNRNQINFKAKDFVGAVL